MYISTTPTTNKLFRLPTKTKQTTVQSSKLIPTNDTVHSFNVKPIKMLSDPVAEAFGLIHRHPSGENFWCVCMVLNCMLDSLVNTHHLQQYSPFSLHYWSSWIMSDQTKVELNFFFRAICM